MQLIYEVPAAQDYVSLRLRSGMGSKDLKRSQIALKNSLFTVSMYDQEELIGFGRVVGDEGITCVVSDIMVDREYQRKGYAEQIMKAIDCYFEEHIYQPGLLQQSKNDDRALGPGDVGCGVQLSVCTLDEVV